MRVIRLASVSTLLCLTGTALFVGLRHTRPTALRTYQLVAAQPADQPKSNVGPSKNKTEPAWRIVPGESCDKVRQLLGNESETDDYDLTWKERDMEISLILANPNNCVATGVLYFVNPGHSATTPDGVVLGEDTITAASKRLAQRVDKSALSVWQGEGQVHAALDIDPSGDFPFWRSYDWSLDQRKADRVIREREPRLSDFTNEPVEFYSIDSFPPATKDASVR